MMLMLLLLQHLLLLLLPPPPPPLLLLSQHLLLLPLLLPLPLPLPLLLLLLLLLLLPRLPVQHTDVVAAAGTLNSPLCQRQTPMRGSWNRMEPSGTKGGTKANFRTPQTKPPV